MLLVKSGNKFSINFILSNETLKNLYFQPQYLTTVKMVVLEFPVNWM
jgi:hypothetical protein